MKKLMLVVVLIAGFVTSGFAQARPTLGVLPFTGGAGDEGDVIASLFLGQRELLSVFNVVPRNMALNAIFAERNIQLSDLTDPNTMASINRMLNADYVLSGSITRVGDRNLLIASIIHVERFEQVAGYFVTYRNIEEILGLLPSMSSGMAGAAQRQRTARAPSLAVIPFAHRAGVSAQDAETLAQLLAIEILNTGRYAVVPRLSIIQAALREQGFQMMGYTDNAGMASLGRAMNADFVLGGSITGLGATNLFLAQILNVEGGGVVSGENVQYRAIADGIELMGELAILLSFPPGAERDRRLAEQRTILAPGATLADQLAWLRANAVTNGNYLIEITGNVTIDTQMLTVPDGRTNVTITIHGIGAVRTVSLSSNGALFTVGSGVILKLGENIILQSRSGNRSSTVHIRGGTLIMNAGSRITGSGAGAVSVHDGGAFYMHGGTISYGQQEGVFIFDGTFTMYGGTISGTRGRGGVSVSRGTFTMRGGTISGNQGGVFINTNGLFTMYGGTISNNTSIQIGDAGGVEVFGTFVMHGGTITGNRGGPGWTSSNGTGGQGGPGGVGIRQGGGVMGTFVRHGGTISGNTGGQGGAGRRDRDRGSNGANDVGRS